MRQYRLRCLPGIVVFSCFEMSESKPFCVFCKKKSDPLNSFSKDIFTKCQAILKIRKENDLSMSDVKLTEQTSSASKYHSKCYRAFSALSKNYREKKENDSSETLNVPR